VDGRVSQEELLEAVLPLLRVYSAQSAPDSLYILSAYLDEWGSYHYEGYMKDEMKSKHQGASFLRE
jgi:hypothetical protein